MNLWQRFWGHLGTVCRHRHKVFVHCVKVGIPWQGLKHDLSKFSPSEFFISVKHFQGFRSPNEGERDTYGYSLAWMHHKGRNRHHYEYWNDYDKITKQVVPVKMPFKYVAEMFCDRLAASKTYKKGAYKQTDPLDYFMAKKGHREIHPATEKELHMLLIMLAEKGEKETFAYIREQLKVRRREERYVQQSGETLRK